MPNWPAIESGGRLSEHQVERCNFALQRRVGILAGSPGTGKTYCLGEVASKIVQEHGIENLAVACPTGKAAVRMTESLQASGVDIRARTIHSLLKVEAASDRGGWSFVHNADNPLPYHFLLLDESSMIDTATAAALMSACPKGSHVLWTGDPNQLPPVGHGAPLRDLIAAGLPYGELREIRRNSGGIVEACAAIRDGHRWQPGDNLQLVETGSPEQQINRVRAAISEAAAAGLDPVWDCQVLAAVNKKSQLSRVELNKFLQAELNQRPGVPGQPFRVGDKIVNTKNGYFPVHDLDADDAETQTNDRDEVYVANGELAEVLDVSEKLTIAELSSPYRVIKIPRGKASENDEGEAPLDDDSKTNTGCSWELGYCLSTHKAQGSEFKWAIVLGDEYPGARMVCDRSWLYTSISRSKERCILVGKRQTFDSMCRKQYMAERKTLLRERILLEIAKRELACI